ncbi:MAG: hypothetical protein ACOC4G_09800, partial [Bacillota bacterium]
MKVFLCYDIGTMYIRRTSRKNKDGSKVTYVQLAHNEWDSEKGYSKTNVIYSFGREDELDTDVLKRLVDSINRYLKPQQASLFQDEIKETTDFVFEYAKRFGDIWTL